MLNPTSNNYQITLFNKSVRNAVKENATSFEISERWANPQRICLQATNQKALYDTIKVRFPAAKGFVVLDVQ